MRGRTRVLGTVVGVLTLVAGVTGCTSGDEEPDGGATAAAGGDAQVLTAGDGGGVVEFTAPGVNGYDGDVRVAVQSLTVDGDVMELRVALTPLDDGEDGDGVTVYDMAEPSPVLSDVEHLTQYTLLGRPNDTWQSDVFATAATDRPVLYQGWFAAPHDDVEALDLVLTEDWPTVLDVPVTRP